MSLLSIVIVSICSLIFGCVLGGLFFSSFEMESVGLFFSSLFFGIIFSAISTILFVSLKGEDVQKFLNKNPSGNMTEKKHKTKKEYETKNDEKEKKKEENNLLKSKWMASYDDKKFTTEEFFLLKEVQEDARTRVYDKALTLEETPSNKNLNSFRNELFKTYDELSR